MAEPGEDALAAHGLREIRSIGDPLGMRVATRLRTLAALVVLPILIAVLASLGALLGRLGARARSVHPIYLAFARAALWVGGTRLEVRGRERVEAGTAYVVVSNHESAWDPLCLITALPQLAIRFVVKESIMRAPFLGNGLRATGNVLVVRTHTASDVNRIETGMERRDPEASLLFFAEGTRSRDGALHPFKKGAFATAERHGLPILPVALAGTYRVWPKGVLRLRPGRVVVTVGAPIRPGAPGQAERARLVQCGFEAVRALRAAARAALRAEGDEPGGVD